MIWISHPTGNEFVRALLAAGERGGTEFLFHTTVGRPQGRGGRLLRRREFPVAPGHLQTRPARELVRLLATALGARGLTAHEIGWASVDAVYQDLDRAVARRLRAAGGAVQAVHAYEDGARETFEAATAFGVRRSYELPIAYWETARRILTEEAARLPAWEPTLGATRDSAAKCDRKTREAELADAIVCPSRFVAESLPPAWRAKAVLAPFGSPVAAGPETPGRPAGGRPLRVLFAGSLSQRKGLADLFAALRLLPRGTAELVLLGSWCAPPEFYRREYPEFTYLPTRPHPEVLAAMRTCDVLCLPSLVEGRALVVQEAMSQGLPVIVTPHTGADDLVADGRNGFVVPVRAPAAIAEKLAWLADHPEARPELGRAARAAAARLTWPAYAATVLAVARGQSVTC
jgi:glycosyltransferase involved in cell wall biosynthesis